MFNLITRANSGGGGSSALATTLGDKYVRQTRFALISSGTGGQVAPTANATNVLDDFGGVVDAVISAVASSRPTFAPAKDASGNIITTTFDSAGNWVLSGTPTSYPVAILYRTRMKFVDVDNTSTDIVGESSLENADPLQASLIGLSTASASAITSTDTVLTALGKAQAQIDGKEAALGNPAVNGSTLVSTTGGVRSWVANITDNVAEGSTNLYFTAARALAAITMFTLAKNSASPNATIPVMSITPNDAATDASVAIVPKGQGSFALQVADGTTTGGNARGTNAVDLQLTRTAATQVSSGSNSFTAGARCLASAANAVAMGLSTQATNTSSTALGNGCVASGANSLAAGNGNVSAGNGGTAIGASSAASGINSFTHGLQGSAFSFTARHVFSSGWHSVAGDAQISRWRVKAATTDATATVMTVDGGGATGVTRIGLQFNNVYYFKGQILGKQTAASTATAVGCWTITGMVMMGTTLGSIILVGTPTVTAVSNTGTWGTPTVTVDTTNGALILTVTGKAATTIRWGATIETEEIIYA